MKPLCNSGEISKCSTNRSPAFTMRSGPDLSRDGITHGADVLPRRDFGARELDLEILLYRHDKLDMIERIPVVDVARGGFTLEYDIRLVNHVREDLIQGCKNVRQGPVSPAFTGAGRHHRRHAIVHYFFGVFLPKCCGPSLENCAPETRRSHLLGNFGHFCSNEMFTGGKAHDIERPAPTARIPETQIAVMIPDEHVLLCRNEFTDNPLQTAPVRKIHQRVQHQALDPPLQHTAAHDPGIDEQLIAVDPANDDAD